MTFNRSHKRRTPRHSAHPYTEGAYFVTLCTHAMHPFFGEVTDDGMQPNMFGDMAASRWWAISDHFSNVTLDAFIVMPNHVHGILTLTQRTDVSTNDDKPGDRRDVACYVPTRTPQSHHSRISPKPGSLGAVMRSYKAAVTKQVREYTGDRDTVWQGRYHDRIIRDKRELHAFRQYIRNNPAKWAEDKFYRPRK